MTPLHLALVCTTLILGSNGFVFELDGHLSSISPKDVAAKLTNRAAFGIQERTIYEKFSQFLGDGLQQLVIDRFEIHGTTKPTAIFRAYISTSVDRNTVIAKVQASEDTTIFFLKPIDAIPSLSPTPEELASPVTSCQNGGILLPNATCACPGFYKGDQCEIVKCLHHGIQNRDRCSCPPGVYSVNCEPKSCTPAVKDNLDNSKQSFMIVINQKISMDLVLNTIFGELPELIGDIQKVNPTLIQNFIVVSYVETEDLTYMTNFVTTDLTDFLNYINSILALEGSEKQPTNQAILHIQSNGLMRAFSNIFVFTDSEDIDATNKTDLFSSTDTEMQLILKTMAWRSRIVYLIANTINNTVNSSSDGFMTYNRVAEATLGDVISFDPKETVLVMDPVLYYYQQNENLAARYFSFTEVSQNFYFKYEEEQEFVYTLITVPPNTKLPKVTDTDGGKISPDVHGERFMLFRTYQSVLTAIQVTTPTPSLWNIRIFVNSDKTALVSYLADKNIDVGTAETPTGAKFAFSAALLGVWPGRPEVGWIDLRGDEYLTVSVVARNNTEQCTYSYRFETTEDECPIGAFGHEVSTNNFFRRLIPGFCGRTDPHQTVPFQCYNGGTRSGVGQCICAEKFLGKDCSKPKCFNGGQQEQFPGNGRGLCSCPQGYGGDHCDVLACTKKSNDYFDFNSRTLAVVIQTSLSQAQVNSKIITGVTKMIQLMSGQYSFDEYVVTAFNTITQNGQAHPVLAISKFLDVDNFLDALQPLNLQYQASQVTNQSAFEAISKTIERIDNDKSSIFVFADSPPTDVISEHQIIMETVEQQLEINTVITAPFSLPSMCVNSTLMDPFLQIASRTGGIYMNLCNHYSDDYIGDPIVQMFIGYGSSHHHTERLGEVYSVSTYRHTIFHFYIDDPTTEVFAFVNSDVTESFTVTVEENIIPTEPIVLDSISSQPFLGVYSISPIYNNMKGYFLNVTAAKGAREGQCFVRIVERTQMAAYFGFSLDPSRDRDSRTMLYGQAYSPVVHLSSVFQQDPGLVLTISDKGGNTLYTSASMTREASCEYEAYFPPFVCTITNFDYMLELLVYIGPTKILQRSQRGYCYNAPDICLNGAVFSTANNTCVCQEDYYGPNCQYAKCDGMTDTYMYNCKCYNMFSGDVCQFADCYDMNYMATQDVREQEFRQIIFVLNVNKDMLLPNIYLSGSIQKFMDQSESDGLPKMYSLITYQENSATNVASTSNADEFIAIFKYTSQQFVNTIPDTSDSLDALDAALQLIIERPATIFLFAGSNPGRPTDMYAPIRQQNGVQVNVFNAPLNVVYPQQPGGRFASLLSVAARQSTGRVLPVTQNVIAQFTPVLLSALSENSLIMDDAAKDCSGGVNFTFALESDFSSLVIDVNGNGVSTDGAVLIYDENEVAMVPSSAQQIVLKDNAAMIVRIDSDDLPKSPGATGNPIMISVKTSSGSCFVQARTSSKLKVAVGFTSDNHQDFVKREIFAGFGSDRNTFVTFRVQDPQDGSMSKTRLYQLETYQTDPQTPWQDYAHITTLPINRRNPNTCANQFISQQFTVNKTTYQKFIVRGRDSKGFEFQRTWFYSMPQLADSGPTCVFGERNKSGECVCTSSYSGDYCDQPICQNGGTQAFRICVCPSGYYGTFCEQYIN